MTLASALLPLLLVASPLDAVSAQRGHSNASTRLRAEEEIRARTAAFSRAIVAASASGWSAEAVARVADFYAADTVVFPPRSAPLRGRPALRAYWTRTPDRRILSHSATAERIDVSGTLATEWGTLTLLSQTGDAEPAEGSATYISIWRRDRGGVWRKLMDTWW
jgi:ketosteroid isomerase-like protein